MSGLEHEALEAAGNAIEWIVGGKAAGWAGNKLFGPTFDKIGLDVANRYSQSRLSNFIRISKNAAAKAGLSLDQPGEVNPRIAMKILEEGSLCDEPVMAEYFGGIMAGARTPDGRDDRGLTWASLVSRLSTSDIHLHFLFYDAFRRLHLAEVDLALGVEEVRNACEVFVDRQDILEAMGLKSREHPWSTCVVPAIESLVRTGLLGRVYISGPAHDLAIRKGIDSLAGGAVLTPSLAGIELFMWAFNHGGMATPFFLVPQLNYISHEHLTTLSKARKLNDMVRERKDRLARRPGHLQ